MTLDEAIAVLEKMRECEEDEEFEPPSNTLIDRAVMFVKMFGMLFHLPTRIVMNGEGGIAFEWRDGGQFDTMEISKSRQVEICQYKDCRLTNRTLIGKIQ